MSPKQVIVAAMFADEKNQCVCEKVWIFPADCSLTEILERAQSRMPINATSYRVSLRYEDA